MFKLRQRQPVLLRRLNRVRMTTAPKRAPPCRLVDIHPGTRVAPLHPGITPPVIPTCGDRWCNLECGDLRRIGSFFIFSWGDNHADGNFTAEAKKESSKAVKIAALQITPASFAVTAYPENHWLCGVVFGLQVDGMVQL